MIKNTKYIENNNKNLIYLNIKIKMKLNVLNVMI